MTNTTLKLPRDLRTGDVIRAHGARWIVTVAPVRTNHEVTSFGETFVAETRFVEEIVPGSFSGYESMKREGYAIQGNSHPAARRVVEVPAFSPAPAKRPARVVARILNMDNSNWMEIRLVDAGSFSFYEVGMSGTDVTLEGKRATVAGILRTMREKHSADTYVVAEACSATGAR